MLTRREQSRQSSAEMTRDWTKTSQTNDPGVYAGNADNYNQRSQVYRQRCTEAIKAERREKAKLRMRAVRARKKQEQTSQPGMAWQAQEVQRAHWGEEKNRWLAKEVRGLQRETERPLGTCAGPAS